MNILAKPKSTIKRKKYIWAAVLFSGLVLICIPRFNRQDLGLSLTPGGKPATEVLGDAAQYMSFVKYFRGEPQTPPLRPPFAYRPLAPFIASYLPFDEMTSINLVNFGGLLLALFFIYKTLIKLNFGFNLSILGCCLFVFAFPTFYYSTIGFIDPVMMGFTSASTYFILAREWPWFFLTLGLGLLSKETTIIILPVLILFLLFIEDTLKKKLIIICFAVIESLLILYFVRAFSLVSLQTMVWKPSIAQFIKNASRNRSYLSFALTLGIPGIISLVGLFRYRRQIIIHLYPMLIGFFMSILLFVFAMFTAYADGRFIWPSVIFTIPISVQVLSQWYPHLKDMETPTELSPRN